ncbi:MAG TPA: hypothetical protein PLC98_24545, partial [Anaerolineales bacterium]|nr:hypothetical protein [Anaerolineales bacterium]
QSAQTAPITSIRLTNVQALAGLWARIERERGANVTEIEIVSAHGRIIGWRMKGDGELHGYSPK